MRWDELKVEAEEERTLPGYRDAAVVRRFDAPEALDTRFYEVRAKSALNRVPKASRMPFRWTINPYRGCSHACVYCFARNTHTYLDLDAGADFDSKVVVKVNAAELLRRELAAPRHQRPDHERQEEHERDRERDQVQGRPLFGLLPAAARPYQVRDRPHHPDDDEERDRERVVDERARRAACGIGVVGAEWTARRARQRDEHEEDEHEQRDETDARGRKSASGARPRTLSGRVLVHT